MAACADRCVARQGKPGLSPAPGDAIARAEADPVRAIGGSVEGGAPYFGACAAPQPGYRRIRKRQAIRGRPSVVQSAKAVARLPAQCRELATDERSEEHTSELQSLRH